MLLQITDTSDRSIWINHLLKIAYPVIHNLAKGNLQKKMPTEIPSNYYYNPNKVSFLEAVGRTLAGIAPWLSLPDDDSEEGKLRKQIRHEVLLGLKNATNPSSSDFLNFTEYSQPIVDAAYLALAFFRAPEALWTPLDKLTKYRFINSFKSLRNRTGAYNNWLLFTGLTESFLLSIGEQSDPFRILISKTKGKEWYIGDGWYSDGCKFSMDYYNSYVIHPMMVMILETLSSKHIIHNSEFHVALQRMIRYAEYSERIISPSGTYPVLGRSVTYRSAAFHALADVALREKLPAHLSPSQVRCALTAVHKNLYDGQQNFDSKGWMVLGFNGLQPEIADPYTSTGSLYMATLSFLPLGLPSNNKFWTDPPSEWTSEKAWTGKKYNRDEKLEY